jgi:hypothetical protein
MLNEIDEDIKLLNHYTENRQHALVGHFHFLVKNHNKSAKQQYKKDQLFQSKP